MASLTLVEHQIASSFSLSARGRQVLRELDKEFGLLYCIGDHLGFDVGDWNYSCRFISDFARAFLYQFKEWVVSVQILPCRKTFRTLFLKDNTNSAQKVVIPRFPFHAACAQSQELELAYGIQVPGANLFMGSEDDYEARNTTLDEPFWTKVEVRRFVPGALENREYWFFIAYERDRQRIQAAGTVPVLERSFRNDIQESPLVSFCAYDPSGTWLQSHCFSLDPISGKLLDLRQSRPSLEHHCRSAPHNHSGLGNLVCGKRWEWNA